MIKISIIIPVFNAEKYIKQTLDSVLEQTLNEIEVICVDDDSDDNSLNILHEYENRDHRIIVIENKEKSDGAALARNIGLNHSNGEYLYFLDADDWIEPEAMEIAYDRLKTTGSQIVIFDLFMYDQITMRTMTDTLHFFNTKLIPDKEVFSYKDIENRQIFYIKNGVAWNMVVKRDFVIENGIVFFPALYDDDVFTYECLACAEKITSINKKLITYRINSGTSQTDKRNKYPLDGIKVYSHLKQRLMMQGVYDEVKGSFLSRAISDNRVFLMGMRDYNSYSQLYTELKEKGLDEFGFSSERKEDFMYPYMYEFAMSVDKYDISEYTYLNANKQKAAAFMYTSPFEFPYTSVNKEDRVVLYGAGKVGESYYLQNIINKYCKIVLWVDRDLTNKPSEVKGVGCINDVIFDKLIIAVNSNNLKDEIRDSLVKIGVENKKIY